MWVQLSRTANHPSFPDEGESHNEPRPRRVIRMRPSQRTQNARPPVVLRRLKVPLGDRGWTEPLPINTYLIDHPDGPILFDAGESPHATDRGWFPWWQPFFRHAVDIKVGATEGIDAPLLHHGLAPEDLQAVVVSRLHHDHADGLKDLTGRASW